MHDSTIALAAPTNNWLPVNFMVQEYSFAMHIIYFFISFSSQLMLTLPLNSCSHLFQETGISGHRQTEAASTTPVGKRKRGSAFVPRDVLHQSQSCTVAQEPQRPCDDNKQNASVHQNKNLILTFNHPLALGDLEAVQHMVKPTHAVFALNMVKKIQKELRLTALDSTGLDSCFRIMLPTNDSESYPGDYMNYSASLYSVLALAVNFSNFSSYQKGTVSIQDVLSCLVQATQVQQIVVMSQHLNGQCKQKEAKLPVSSALQELATMLPATIHIYGDVNSIAKDTESIMKSETLSLVFEPKQLLDESGSNPPKVSLILGLDTTLKFVFSAYTGRFWALVPSSLISQYKRACRSNEMLKAKLDELCDNRGTFKKRKSDSAKMYADGDTRKIHDLCSSLHEIVFELHRRGGLLLPVFTQHGILRLLTNQRDQTVTLSPAPLVMQIGALSIQALPDLHALDSALGMVLGQHFFDPVSTHYFLCESLALLCNWRPIPKETASFHLDCNKFCADCTKLLCHMGPLNSEQAPSAMRAAIAAATVLAMVMPVDQALDCWKSFNRGIVSVHSMSTGVKSAGCALISLVAFARQENERLQSDLESAKEVLHCFFEQLQSEDQGVQLLKILFLSKEVSKDPFSCSEEAESIGEVLSALRLVCQNPSMLQCLQKIEHGKPSASIVGLVAGALIGVSGLDNVSHLPCIHSHQKAQLQAIISVLANCYEVLIFVWSCEFTIGLK